MNRKSRGLGAGIIVIAAAAGIAPRADALTWYWANGPKCMISEHPPAYELARTRSLGARIVDDKAGRTEVVLPSLEAYKSFMAKGFHFVFFKNQQTCAAYLKEQDQIKAEQQRAHQEYEKELQKYR
ncbi:MAG TPA: hypothetical protein VGR91_10845 [Stellaceae bacterium]|nr:hypothetical protein [Stellaceae bacterium]